MSWFVIDLFAGVFSFLTFLFLLFYIYPAMKKEWKEKGRDWRYYYTVCGDNNRRSYRQLFRSVLTIVMKK